MIERDDAADAFNSELVELMALIRRVVAACVGDRDAVDEIVQETVTRLLAARGRLAGRALGPYAIVTARNLVAARWRRADVERRHQHRLVDTERTDVPDEEALRKRDAAKPSASPPSMTAKGCLRPSSSRSCRMRSALESLR